jgi:hypothetical protein
MDAAVPITFGPFWDVMFRIFVVFGIFAFAGITMQYLELEIRSWFGKKDAEGLDEREPRDPENDGWYNDEAKRFRETYQSTTPELVTYVVQWGVASTFEGRSHLVITKDFEDAIDDLLVEYGDGYIRYRLAGDDENMPEWTNAGFQTKEEVFNASDR